MPALKIAVALLLLLATGCCIIHKTPDESTYVCIGMDIKTTDTLTASYVDVHTSSIQGNIWTILITSAVSVLTTLITI